MKKVSILVAIIIAFSTAANAQNRYAEKAINQTSNLPNTTGDKLLLRNPITAGEYLKTSGQTAVTYSAYTPVYGESGYYYPSYPNSIDLEDTAICVERQFIKELNGVKYGINLKLYANAPSKNSLYIQALRLGSNMCKYYTEDFYRIAPYAKDFKVFTDGDHLVAQYVYLGEIIQIEFE